MNQGPILIIEDDEDTREGLKLLLEEHGYEVALAPDGAEGMAQLRSGLRPALILLDLRMPEKNGFQFRVEQILDPELSKIPVVVYSGDPDAFNNSVVLGAVANLGKPLDGDRLLEVVKNCCPA